MNKESAKTLILAAVLIYVISPVDIAPGLLDDIIVAIAGVIARSQLSGPK